MTGNTVTVRITVDRDPSNEATGWLPPASTVVAELLELLVDLDLDTGWLVTAVEMSPDPPTRPWLVSYRGTRIHESEVLWGLYETLRDSKDERERTFARQALYSVAGAGGWDDVCEHCPLHHYEHKGADHAFISEEQ